MIKQEEVCIIIIPCFAIFHLLEHPPMVLAQKLTYSFFLPSSLINLLKRLYKVHICSYKVKQSNRPQT